MKKLSKINRGFRLFIIVGMFASGSWANTNPVDHTEMLIDARAIGMGGAYTAAAFGVEATFYNPAGLSLLKGREFSSMLSSGMAFDRSFSFVGIASNPGFDNKLSAAVSWSNAGWGGGFSGYDENNNPTGDFDVKENSLMVSFAEYLDFLDLNWGATVKMFNSTVDNDEQAGFGLDIGAIYQLGDVGNFHDVILGAVVKDVYSQIDDEMLDPRVNVGFSAFLSPNLFTVGDFGFTYGSDSDFRYAFGVEYKYALNGLGAAGPDGVPGGIYPRIGLNTGDFYFGFGIQLQKFAVDYAFVPKPNEEFKNTHRFSLVIPF